MRALIVKIAIAVAVAGCTTSPEVEALLASSDGGVTFATGGGAGAGGEAGTGGSGGDGAGGDEGDPTSFDAGTAPEGAAREGGGPDRSAPPIIDGAADIRVTPVDASDSGPPRAIRCGGNAMCDLATEYCCAESNNFRCLKRTQTAACARFVERLYCDERTDCPAGQVCCLATNMPEMRDDATCSADCSSGFRLCDPARPSGCEAPSICADNVPVASYLACRD